MNVEKNENEFFPTPEQLARFMVEVADRQFTPVSSKQPRVLEPSAGDGTTIAANLQKKGWSVTALEPYIEPKTEVTNWIKVRFEDFVPTDEFDLVVMNPPFTQALEHIKKGLECLRS